MGGEILIQVLLILKDKKIMIRIEEKKIKSVTLKSQIYSLRNRYQNKESLIPTINSMFK